MSKTRVENYFYARAVNIQTWENLKQYGYTKLLVRQIEVPIKGLKETTHGYKKERNKAKDFTCKLQYDVSIFSNRRQSDFTKCSLMINQREIMISRLA